MRGQWIGGFTGAYPGILIANIDDRKDYYSGSASLLPQDQHLPPMQATFRTQSKAETYHAQTTSLLPVNPATGQPESWDTLAKLFPNVQISTSATIEGSFTESALIVKIKTDLGLEISATMTATGNRTESQIGGELIEWDSFKSRVAERLRASSARGLIFRGQAKPWMLRTSFHRNRRYDLVRFINEDVPSLHQYVGTRLTTRLRMTDPQENGALLSLVQHHGYPTNLLDWTYSPYIAAYFAFQHIPAAAPSSDKVRIFVFDRTLWHNDWQPVFNINAASLELSVIELLAIENERAIPQQSVSMVTNADDIERYVLLNQATKSHVYLTAFDIPYSERNKAIRDLAYMGITAGSLFPGIGGICEELRQRNFDY